MARPRRRKVGEKTRKPLGQEARVLKKKIIDQHTRRINKLKEALTTERGKTQREIIISQIADETLALKRFRNKLK
jgi:hypothetical protein